MPLNRVTLDAIAHKLVTYEYIVERYASKLGIVPVCFTVTPSEAARIVAHFLATHRKQRRRRRLGCTTCGAPVTDTTKCQPCAAAARKVRAARDADRKARRQLAYTYIYGDVAPGNARK